MTRLPFRSLFNVIHRVEEFLIAWAMILIAGLTIANVISRTVFDYPLAFAEELTQFLIILVCFVGLSYAASQGRHIRMTALYDLLPLRPRKVLMIVIAAVTGALMFFLAYASLAYIHIIRDLGPVSPVLRLPLYIVYFSVPLGLVLAGIQYVLTVIRNLTDGDNVYMSYDRTDAYDAPSGPTEADPAPATHPTAAPTQKEHGRAS